MSVNLALGIDEAHILEEGGLSQGDSNDGTGIAKCQLAHEADRQAHPEAFQVPLFLFGETFRHVDEKTLWQPGDFGGVLVRRYVAGFEPANSLRGLDGKLVESEKASLAKGLQFAAAETVKSVFLP